MAPTRGGTAGTTAPTTISGTIGRTVGIARFTERLAALSGTELRAVARTVRRELEGVDREVAWWRATIELDATLRRQRRTREAGLVAHRASQAVLAAARRNGLMETDREAVIVVARAASDAARALLVPHGFDGPSSAALSFVVPWRPLVDDAA